MIQAIISAAVAALIVLAFGLEGCSQAQPMERLTDRDRVQLNNLINRSK